MNNNFSNLSFDELVRNARKIKMTPEELEEQRRNFAYGNLKIENQNVTRELIDSVADELAKSSV